MHLLHGMHGLAFLAGIHIVRNSDYFSHFAYPLDRKDDPPYGAVTREREREFFLFLQMVCPLQDATERQAVFERFKKGSPVPSAQTQN
ncbi:hypothetical protein E2320_020478 [Naja naja]|nr:hypothetical protein E2320_020478 [Naja naja]